MKARLIAIYNKLFSEFGSQHWWPAESSFEVIVGAILTQNTNWSNVEKAIGNLKKENRLLPKKLSQLSLRKLAKLIRPSGYYNIKAKRLRSFLDFFFKKYQGDLKRMFKSNLKSLRQELLSIKGIGPETADSILLYAAHKPIFVIDAYTKRILQRHKIITKDTDYQETQKVFMSNLPRDGKLFNEYHALLVKLGKEFFLKNNPKCNLCPLK